MKRHIEGVHEGIKNHSCPVCKKEFYKKTTRDIHIMTVHEGKKLNLCNICGSNFKTKKVLNEHIESIHDGIKENYKEDTTPNAYT